MGIVDSRDKHRSIEVWMSRIIDVSEGEKDGELRYREDWLAVLALMVGQPVAVPAQGTDLTGPMYLAFSFLFILHFIPLPGLLTVPGYEDPDTSEDIFTLA